jgi:hypothetical protein
LLLLSFLVLLCNVVVSNMRREWYDLLLLGLLSALVRAWAVEKRDAKPVVKPAPLGMP